MSEYDLYVENINKIYSYIELMKQVWPNADNLNYIENIETYKQIVVENAKLFSKTDPPKSQKVEELSNE